MMPTFEIDDSVIHVRTTEHGEVLAVRGKTAVMLQVKWSINGKEEWLPADLLRKDDRQERSVAHDIFHQQNGDVTKAYYDAMNAKGLPGQLAVALFRAQKRSTAAKKYRGRRFTQDAYSVKNWSMSEVCRILTTMQAFESAPRWGWKRDPKTPGYEWVLYVDLPTGQCSFHSADRLSGPDYAGDWDGAGMSTERICRYCDLVAAN